MEESSPTLIGSDRGHPCNFKGYPGDQEERGIGRSSCRELSERVTFREEVKPTQELIAFNDDNLEGTIQLHNDALVVKAQINGFIVKRVLIDQGSGAEVMYPDQFRGLGLKNEDLSKYDLPLVGFDGRMVIPEE